MKILVPTDFSKNARRAIEYAVMLAAKSKAEIVVLHAYRHIDTKTPSRKLLFEEYNYSIARKLHDELEIQRGIINKIHPGIKVSAELSDKEVKQSILEASRGMDLIVMGTQGAASLKNIFMGSTTASVIGHTAIPVLAIPRSYKRKEPKNILLTTNRFETDPQILNNILQLVHLFKARLHIIVFTDTDTAIQADYIIQKESLVSYQKEWKGRDKNIRITAAHLKGSEFEDTVQQYINTHAIDLLAMVTYKRNFLENIFRRSATRKMAYRSQIPLLAIPDSTDKAG